MNKSELVRAISYSSDLTYSQAKEAIECFIKLMEIAVNEDEDVTITGFGKFSVKHMNSLKIKNPKNGEYYELPARKSLSFKPSKCFRKLI